MRRDVALDVSVFIRLQCCLIYCICIDTNEKKPVTMNAYVDNQNTYALLEPVAGGAEPPKSMGTSSSLYDFGVSSDTVVEHRTSEREVMT